MKIGILGSGIVGQTLADGFLKYDYKVMIGTRDKNKLLEWKKKTQDKGKIGSFEETADFGEIIILAVKGSVAKDFLELVKNNISNKIIIDVTNPISDESPENGVLRFFTSLDNSLMEQLQSAFPKAKFVKAFNSIGSAFMVNPDFESKSTMFICGNDENSKKEVKKILDLFGFEVEDMGKVESARAIEPLCMLWCIPGFLRNEWNHAFKLMKK